MFRYLQWWEVPLVPLLVPLYLLGLLIDKVEHQSWRTGAFLDEWLPRFRVRASRSSRLGRFLLRVTENYSPTLCETVWGTVARPFKARVMHWVYLILIVAGSALGPIAIYRDFRIYGLETFRELGIVFGLSLAAGIAMLTVIGVLVFITRHLCPVKFEVVDNGQGNTAT